MLVLFCIATALTVQAETNPPVAGYTHTEHHISVKPTGRIKGLIPLTRIVIINRTHHPIHFHTH